MSHKGNPLIDAVNNVIDRAPLGSDSKLRLQHYTLLLFLGLPSMSAFGLVLFLKGDYRTGSIVTVTVLFLAVGWLLLGRGVPPTPVYRANTVVFSCLLVYLVIVGGDGGSKILWTYTFPLIAFFLMGKREGGAWVTVVFGLSAAAILGVVPGVRGYAYPPDFQARYLVTMAIVIAIAAGFEHFREEYRLGMERERAKLQAALDDVKALSGLLPICAHCKNIRDDRGYWNKLESYLHDHSEVRFSHGICPDCVQEHYADLELDEPTVS
jgi:hypothetical protein